MFLSGLGTAAPPARWTQTKCWDALVASEYLPTLGPRSQAILRKVLRGNNGICSRHLAFDQLGEAFAFDPDVLDARFAKHAPAVASEAAARALADAGLAPDDIDAVIISTCTGYLCPGLTSYVTERLGLRTDILALDLVGQGCGAALPNMRTGEALITSGRAGRVLSICVEICSAAMYLDDDPGVLISACLFGDGAGWILHAGGREILSAVRQQVGLTEDDTRWSAAILRDYGNVSSPCVYFVLQAALNEQAPGGHWWMSSFGAGFSCHGALLEVE